MSAILSFAQKSFRIHLDAIRENKRLARDRDYFRPDGIQAFYGEQGSGKTLTLIGFMHRIRQAYPKAIVVSNIVLKDMEAIHFNGRLSTLQEKLQQGFDTTKVYIFYASKEEYAQVNQYVKNQKYGVILITDEYQNYFSNQDSKNVPDWVIQQGAQNRKQRRIHLVTSQDYDQIVKATRRRGDIAFKCRTISLPFTHGGILTVYWAFTAKLLEFDSNGNQSPLKRRKMGWFFHSQKLRDSYDTYQVVFTGPKDEAMFAQFNQNVNIQINNGKKGK